MPKAQTFSPSPWLSAKCQVIEPTQNRRRHQSHAPPNQKHIKMKSPVDIQAPKICLGDEAVVTTSLLEGCSPVLETQQGSYLDGLMFGAFSILPSNPAAGYLSPLRKGLIRGIDSNISVSLSRRPKWQPWLKNIFLVHFSKHKYYTISQSCRRGDFSSLSVPHTQTKYKP